MVKKFGFTLLVLLSLTNFLASDAVANNKKDEVVLTEITGRLTDENRQPIGGAQIRVVNEKGEVLESSESDANGSFVVQHRPCVTCDLEVVPTEKTGLASALVEDIPGNVTRRFLLTLQKGFHVRGRIVHQGRGLKGLEVKVVTADRDPQSGKVHAGGAARTSRDGGFNLTLTPGKKILTVSNFRYDNLDRKFDQEFEVSSDTTIGDIALPGVQ